MRDAAGELDHFEPALDVASGVGQHLAVFVREHERQSVHVLLDQRLEVEHDPRATLRIDGGPFAERLLRMLDGLARLGPAREGNLRLHLSGRRIEDVAIAS